MFAKYFALILILTIAQGAAATDERGDALAALARAEAMVASHLNDGAALAARSTLDLIRVAKSAGVLDMPVLIGRIDDKYGNGEFGSVRNVLVKKTSVALEASTGNAGDGNSYVLIHIVLPKKVNAFGWRHDDFSITFLNFTNTGKVRVQVEMGEKRRLRANGRVAEKGLFRDMTFDVAAHSPTSWEQVAYELRENGVTVSPEDKDEPPESACVIALTTRSAR
jgi:hypothetical protein